MMNQEDPESWAVKEETYIQPVTGPIKHDGLGNINKSLDDIIGTTLDVEKLFGREVYHASLDQHGHVNYMRLYDVLAQRSQRNPGGGDKTLQRLERVLDSFNRYRQHRIETDSARTAREELAARAQNLKGVGETFARSGGKSNPKMSAVMWEWQMALERALAKVFEEIELGQMESKRKGKGGGVSAARKKESVAAGLLEFSEMLFKLGAPALAMTLALEMTVFSLKESRRSVAPGALGTASKSPGSFFFTAAIVQSLGKCVEDAYAAAVAKEMEQQMAERAVQQSRQSEGFTTEEQAEIARRLGMLSKSSLASSASHAYWAAGKQAKLTTHDRVELGTRLLTIILDNCKIASTKIDSDPVAVPAFWHTYELHRTKYVGVIKLNESLVTRIARNDIDLTSVVLARTPPMLVKPRPWTSSTDGGYWYTKQSLLTSRPDNAPEQHAYLRAATKGGYMDDFLMCLDDLSQCAWAVNQRVLDVVLQIWKSGDGMLGIPALVRGTDPHELFGAVPRDKLSKDEFNLMTERISLGYILRTAEVFASHGERFYFPYKIDFRGRVYPLTNSGFWHLGADHVRALFQFWYGRALGPHGLKWLKIQLANMYGVDKVSNSARVRFVDEHWAEVVDSAERPLEGSRWWTKADKPFQALAACMEVVAAVKSGDPASYVSRLAVSQDGSCNGLQHYAALGRDVDGALQVNLVQQPTADEACEDRGPQDVYSRVRELVEEEVRHEASLAPGDPGYNAGTSQLARKLVTKITRKVVKQPVMTSVYGVTQFGIVEQVMDKLKGDAGIDRGEMVYCGLYLARHIQSAIRRLFRNAQEIQDWLEECSERICAAVRWDVYGDARVVGDRDFLQKYVTVVKWTTPLGLPVVQPYRKAPLMLIRAGGLQTIALQNPFELSYTNKQKQKNGIAPNYIHGLDSTHLLMTAHECVAQHGITFAAVHDSFWTHARDVETMGGVLRAQFVKLHSGDLVADLKREFEVRYEGYLQCVYVSAASAAGLEIQRLRASYFFSGGGGDGKPARDEVDLSEFKLHARDAVMVLRHELGEEYNRWKLLSSDTEADRLLGESILTPSVLIEKHQEPVVWKIGGKGGRVYEEYGWTVNPATDDASDAASDSEDPVEPFDGSEDKDTNGLVLKSHKWLRVLVPVRIPAIPARGELDIEKVLDSEYFFS